MAARWCILWQQYGAYYGSLLDCRFLSLARSSSTLVRIKLHNPAWVPCKSHPETRWMVSNWQMHHIHPAWHSLDKKLATTCEFRVKSVPCECKEGNAHVSLPWTIIFVLLCTLTSFLSLLWTVFFITTLNSFFVSIPWTIFFFLRDEKKPGLMAKYEVFIPRVLLAPILPFEPLI